MSAQHLYSQVYSVDGNNDDNYFEEQGDINTVPEAFRYCPKQPNEFEKSPSYTQSIGSPIKSYTVPVFSFQSPNNCIVSTEPVESGRPSISISQQTIISESGIPHFSVLSPPDVPSGKTIDVYIRNNDRTENNEKISEDKSVKSNFISNVLQPFTSFVVSEATKLLQPSQDLIVARGSTYIYEIREAIGKVYNVQAEFIELTRKGKCLEDNNKLQDLLINTADLCHIHYSIGDHAAKGTFCNYNGLYYYPPSDIIVNSRQKKI